MDRVTIEGFVAAGFEPVRDTFADNFAQRGEVGAQVCVYQHGKPVVELGGGLTDPDADTGRPFGTGTLIPVFSISKAIVATATLMLVERGALDLDAPVAGVRPGR